MLDYFLGLPNIAKRLEIIIDCRTLHARLLRKASAIHPRFSDLADHQIEQVLMKSKHSNLTRQMISENLVNVGAYPSSEIENGIELQRLLNNARRCKSYHHNSKQKEMAEVKALRGKIQESQKKDSEIIKLFSNIHIWWTYQIEFRFACKSFNYDVYIERSRNK